jgi:hypothetical protein
MHQDLPPRPALVFRVGVIGHRRDRLGQADLPLLASTLRDLLHAIRATVTQFGARHGDLFSTPGPVLRALTPLAEGVDRMFAAAALDNGFELCCPFPFPQPEYERDFHQPESSQPGSLDEFRELLARAARETALTRFEMDGDAASRQPAYAACGDVVINQSDLLVVVWDGQRLQRVGGTENALDDALRKGVPVVCVDARAPHTWRIMGSPSTSVHDVVLAELELPVSAHREHEGSTSRDIRDFYRERWPRVDVGVLWRTFGGTMGFGSRSRASADEDGPPAGDTAPVHAATRAVADRLRPFLSWPDRLAVYYSDLYRSSFVITYLMAAAAVGMALLPLALGWNVFAPHAAELVFIVTELLLISAILTIVWRGRAAGWHERWLDYRLAAELVRQIRFVAPLGGRRPLPPTPSHFSAYGHPGLTWMAWYARAIQREIGLPATSLDRATVVHCVEDVRSMIVAQSQYHARVAARSHRIEHRLHGIGISLMIVTLLAGIVHFAAAFEPLHLPLSAPAIGGLIFLCGFLPALGAALAGIGNQAEFRRVAKRSTAMRDRFDELAAAAGRLIDSLRTAPAPGAAHAQPSTAASDLASRATDHMIGEVLDWRVVFLDRPLDPPA